MKKRMVLLGFSFITFIFTTNVAMADNVLNQTDAEKLLKGNTAEGVNTKWDRKMIWYFREDGTVIKQNPAGDRFNHTWSIDKKGQLCYKDGRMDWPECHPIIQRTDGKYDAHDKRWRIDKVLPGNPHNF